MSQDDLQEIERFIGTYVDSVGQLEILLLLHAAHGDALTAGQINDKLLSNRASVENRLANLVQRGLVAALSESKTFRYAPNTPPLAAVVDRLAGLYQSHRSRIIDMIFSPKDRMRNFSDAFRIKDDEEKGNA